MRYLSGPAAVETAGEKIAAAYADGRPQRDSMRIDKIAHGRSNMPLEESADLVQVDGAGRSIYPPR